MTCHVLPVIKKRHRDSVSGGGAETILLSLKKIPAPIILRHRGTRKRKPHGHKAVYHRGKGKGAHATGTNWFRSETTAEETRRSLQKGMETEASSTGKENIRLRKREGLLPAETGVRAMRKVGDWHDDFSDISSRKKET